jgi:hypothetical protein
MMPAESALANYYYCSPLLLKSTFYRWRCEPVALSSCLTSSLYSQHKGTYVLK